jgi:hypothetical protein
MGPVLPELTQAWGGKSNVLVGYILSLPHFSSLASSRASPVDEQQDAEGIPKR